MENNEIRDNTYFGAANGYGGFRSNFNAIFSPEELDKLFIIKGGPGTGKSTLMKKIKERYSSSASIITILCSSDPDSLDGILIKKNGVTIGIADGTAPHVIDAKYPGVIEEIVNLGDGFDFSGIDQGFAVIHFDTFFGGSADESDFSAEGIKHPGFDKTDGGTEQSGGTGIVTAGVDSSGSFVTFRMVGQNE